MVDPAAESGRPSLWARTTPVLSFKTSSIFISLFFRFCRIENRVFLSPEEGTKLSPLRETERERDWRGLMSSKAGLRSGGLQVPRPALLGVGGVGGALAVCRRNGWPGRCSGWIIHLGLESPASSPPARMRQNSWCGVLRSWHLPRVWAILDISCGRGTVPCPTVSPAEMEKVSPLHLSCAV